MCEWLIPVVEVSTRRKYVEVDHGRSVLHDSKSHVEVDQLNFLIFDIRAGTQSNEVI